MWIVLAAFLVVLLVVGGLVLALVLRDDDGPDGDDAPGESSSDPAVVVQSLIDAALAGDCNAAEEHVTDAVEDAGLCTGEEWQMLSAGGVDAEVGTAVTDGDRATVPATFSTAEGSLDYTFTLIRDEPDDDWEVDAYEREGGSAVPSAPASPTDPTEGASTDAPTDTPTSTPTSAAPEGGDLPSFPAGTPEASVVAFIEAARAGDCAEAERWVTRSYLRREGSCSDDLDDLDVFQDFVFDIGEASIQGDTARVRVAITYAGETDDSDLILLREGGVWKIDDDD